MPPGIGYGNFFRPLRALQNPNLGLGGVDAPAAPTAVPPPGQGIGPMRPQPTDMGMTPGGSLPAIGRPKDVTLPNSALGAQPDFAGKMASFAQKNPDLVKGLMGGNQQAQAPHISVQNYQAPGPTFEAPQVHLSDLIRGR